MDLTTFLTVRRGDWRRLEELRTEGPDPHVQQELEQAQARMAQIEGQQAKLMRRFAESADDADFPWDLVHGKTGNPPSR